MITLENNIPHQYARVNEAFSLQIPANTFAGNGISYTAMVARSGNYGVSLEHFWLNFEPITGTFTGMPLGWDDEGSLQIEVIAEDNEGNVQNAYFVIVVYPEGSTCTTVLPRTGAEADYVVNAANHAGFDWSAVQPGETIGFEGVVGKITVFELNGTAANPILLTNVGGIAEFNEEGDQKSINVQRSNYFKFVGQYSEIDPFNEHVYGIVAHSGSSANKLLDYQTPDPAFNFGANGGGTAIEIEANSYNGIELSFVHIPYAGSAGIKIRNKLDELFMELTAGNNSGNTTLNLTSNINALVSATGFLQVQGDRYEYTSFAGSTFQLATPLSKNYVAGAGASTCTGIRGAHDMSFVRVAHCLVRKADTEGVYGGEGFYDGRFAVKWAADGATNTIGSSTLKLRGIDFGSGNGANTLGTVQPTGTVTINDRVHYPYTNYDIATQTFTLSTPLTEDVPDAEKVTINIYPHDIRHARFEWNIIEFSGYEGLQIKNCTENHVTAHNNLRFNSYREVSAQQFGLFIDAGTGGELRDNYVEGVAGTGLRLYCGAPIKIFNNVVIDSGWSVGTSQRQAVYGAKCGTVIDKTNQNVGGYVLTDYVSQPELGTVIEDLIIDFFNNTLHKYGGEAIDFFCDLTFRYGNNLFTGGGSSVNFSGPNINLGGNRFITALEASYEDEPNYDLRIKKDSLAATGGVDYSAELSKDYNFNEVLQTNYAGAFKPGGKISVDNFNYARTYIEPTNPFTSFQWYVRDVGGEWAKIPGQEKINYSPSITAKEYRLGVTVKDVDSNIGDERFGPVFLIE